MLQPKIVNFKERKVFLLNGRAQYIGSSCCSTYADPDSLFNFAELIVTKLKDALPETITDGLIRVDIFDCPGKLSHLLLPHSSTFLIHMQVMERLISPCTL